MKEPLRTKVYRQLLEMIVSGRLTANSFTNEDALMEITGTSRTPVREAVQELEEGRFVKVFPKRGIYISELSIRGLREAWGSSCLLISRTRSSALPAAVRFL